MSLISVKNYKRSWHREDSYCSVGSREEKVKKLKLKKHIREEAMQDKRNELCQLCGVMSKHVRGEKYFAVAVDMSWSIGMKCTHILIPILLYF